MIPRAFFPLFTFQRLICYVFVCYGVKHFLKHLFFYRLINQIKAMIATSATPRTISTLV